VTTVEDDRQARTSGPIKSRQPEAFWTLFVALPAAFSILRLWVESGGQLQTMLLLVSNVSATNLIASMLVTGTPLVTTGIIAAIAIGSVLDISTEHLPADRRPAFARFTRTLPDWFIVAIFVLAFATWKILYLPLLAPAVMVTIQRSNWYQTLDDPHKFKRSTVYLVTIAVYGWLVSPAILDAWITGEFMGIVLFGIPILLVPAVTGPIPDRLAKLISLASPPILFALLLLGAAPVFATPILPVTVTVRDSGAAEPPEYVRGQVIYSNDVNTVILQEKGGVRYIPNSTIREQVLCSTADELPRYRLRVHDLHVEDSLLRALGRRVRSVTVTDAACRVAPGKHDRIAVP